MANMNPRDNSDIAYEQGPENDATFPLDTTTADRSSEGTSLDASKEASASSSLNTIPNGGLDAWLQVVGSFFLFFNSW